MFLNLVFVPNNSLKLKGESYEQTACQHCYNNSVELKLCYNNSVELSLFSILRYSMSTQSTHYTCCMPTKLADFKFVFLPQKYLVCPFLSLSTLTSHYHALVKYSLGLV